MHAHTCIPLLGPVSEAGSAREMQVQAAQLGHDPRKHREERKERRAVCAGCARPQVMPWAGRGAAPLRRPLGDGAPSWVFIRQLPSTPARRMSCEGRSVWQLPLRVSRDHCNEFPRAAGGGGGRGAFNSKHLLSLSLEAGSPRSKYGQGWGLLRWGGGQENLLQSSLLASGGVIPSLCPDLPLL